MAARKVGPVIGLVLAALVAADVPQAALAVEQRYNASQSLKMQFEQSYAQQGRARRETGSLTLLKPGRMRWDYESGKVFVTDGQVLWLYVPSANRAERSKVKQSDDLRAPLAFLLGRLNFARDFREVRTEGNEIVAIPKSEKGPYREVRFVAEPDGRIAQVKVTGQDASVMEFSFSAERRNVPVDARLFRFTPPAGAEIVEVEQ